MHFAKVVLWILLGLWLAVFNSGCGKRTNNAKVGKSAQPSIQVQLDWFPEPEHGAFYTAFCKGYFAEEGIDVTILDGGPNAEVVTKVATGQVQFGQYDSVNSFLAIQQGLPIVNIAAVFQHDPTVLLFQEANPIRDFSDLLGKKIKARPDWAFLVYLKAKYKIDFQLVPQDFGLQELVADPALVQQGFFISEPYFAEQQGVRLKWLRLEDAGYDSCNTIIANRNFVERYPEATRALLRAYYRGYREYCEGDYQAAHAEMMRRNKNVGPDFLEWSRRQIIEGNLAKGDPAKGAAGDYAVVSPERIVRQIQQLEELGILEKGRVTATAAVDVRYLPNRESR